MEILIIIILCLILISNVLAIFIQIRGDRIDRKIYEGNVFSFKEREKTLMDRVLFYQDRAECFKSKDIDAFGIIITHEGNKLLPKDWRERFGYPDKTDPAGNEK